MAAGEFPGWREKLSTSLLAEQWPDELWNDWTPTLEDYKLIKKRIEERINMKPNWYRKTKYVS